jgi:hypothetical protein
MGECVLIILQWSFVFAGALLLWWPGLRLSALAALGVGYGLAALNGALGPEALIAVLLLAGAAYVMRAERRMLHPAAAHVIVLALAGLLFLHLFPGFYNLPVIGPERLTPDAAPYRMYLNLDKPLILFWLLLVCPRQTLTARPLRTSLGVGIAACAATTIACLAVALWFGAVTWAPKWPTWGWLWAANNLLLVAPAEEALFRAYIQAGIAHVLAGISLWWLGGRGHRGGAIRLGAFRGRMGVHAAGRHRRDWLRGCLSLWRIACGGRGAFRPEPDPFRPVHLSPTGTLKGGVCHSEIRIGSQGYALGVFKMAAAHSP